jgi:hypothetical protein
MSGIIIDRADLLAIIAALVATSVSGIAELQEQPTAENAATLADLYRLTARLVKQSGGDPTMFDYNAQQLTRMAADLELAKVGGYDPGINISTATVRP